MSKLPLYTELKADGHYRYRRRVPAKLVKTIGKARLYRNLGKTKDEVLVNWSEAHKEVEGVVSQSFRQAEGSLSSGHIYPASAANCAKPDCSGWSN